MPRMFFFHGLMSFPSATLVLCLWLSAAIAYKLPVLDRSLLNHDDNIIQNPDYSPFVYKWEWKLQDRMDEGTLMLPRLRRDIIDKKFKKEDVKPDKKLVPKVKPTEQALDEFSDPTPYIMEASSVALTKAKIMPLLFDDETTPLSVLEQTTKGAGQTLDEDETTPITEPEQTTKGAGQKFDKVETTHVGKSVAKPDTLATESTLNPTSKKYTKTTQAHTTAIHDTSSTNDNLLEDFTFSSSPKVPENFPSTTPDISHEETTEQATTAGFLASSTKHAAVTHITTSSVDTVQTQSIMKQCMLTILILAVVCTIFIISTIALAAKVSTMKQRNKLRHPVTYTEMRCISSLMPDSDQQNKQPKRLKTFAATMDDGDGDNTTLHSFLPDH